MARMLGVAGGLALGALALCAHCVAAEAAGPAVNQFEMKEVETEAGDIQLQSQNAHTWGQPRRRFVDHGGGNVDYDENTALKNRFALEVEASFTSFFRLRVGVDIEQERTDEPAAPEFANAFDSLKFSEVAIEGVVVLVPLKKEGIGLAWLTEYQHAIAAGEHHTLFTGPLVQAVAGPWSATANLFLVRFLGGEPGERDHKWDFAYAAQVKYEVSKSLALAIEGYGTLDRLGNSGTRHDSALLFGDHDQHRIGPVIYLKRELDGGAGEKAKPMRLGGKGAKKDDDDKDDDKEATVTLGVGLLFGLTPHTPDATLKWSVEIDF